MTLRAGPASRASPLVNSLVASRFIPPGTVSSSPTTSPKTFTSRPATAAPPWTPTPSKSRPGPRSAASKAACCACSPAGARRSPGSWPAGARSRCCSPTIHASPARSRCAGRCRTRPTASPSSRRSPAIPTFPTDRSRPPCSRCSATPTTRAPRSRRCWPAPTSRNRFRMTSRASPTGYRPRSSTPIASIAPTCATSRSRPSIPRRRATSTTRSPSKRCRGAARACGSRSPTSRTTCARDRRSTPRRCAAAAASTFPTAPSRCCPSRCRRGSVRWCPKRIGWRWSSGWTWTVRRSSSTPNSRRR